MIGCLFGTIFTKNPPQIVLMVHGVGYEVEVPMSTFYSLPAEREEVRLITHLAVKEDSHTLYGFSSFVERAAFRELLKVSGIGARTALSILSSLTVAELRATVADRSTSRMTTIPGIGKKTAERMILELQGKFDKLSPPPTALEAAVDSAEARKLSKTLEDVVAALLALGYPERDIKSVTAGVSATMSVSDGIRACLSALAKK